MSGRGAGGWWAAVRGGGCSLFFLVVAGEVAFDDAVAALVEAAVLHAGLFIELPEGFHDSAGAAGFHP